MSEERFQAPSRDAVKRPYERPAFAWEEDFEPYAFSMCGKMPAQGGACTLSKSS